MTDVYKHYDRSTGSGFFLQSILDWYSAPTDEASGTLGSVPLDRAAQPRLSAM